MSEIQTGVTYRVCTACHLLTPVELLQDRDVCQPCGDPDRYGALEPGIPAAHQETLRQLAEVTAERDALKRRVDELERNLADSEARRLHMEMRP